MKLNLFAIKSLSTGKLIPGLFFADKKAAKAERMKLGEATHCVSYGPDHRLFKG